MMSKASVAILGGSGAEGGGLALRFAEAGYTVIIGSREAGKAQDAAKLVAERVPNAKIAGTDNQSAAAQAEIVVLTVPFAAQRSTLESVRQQLQGKILVDVTVPLVPPKVSQVQLPAEHSAAVGAQKLLGESVKVVSAFQNVSAHQLEHLGQPVDCDVLVCGDDKDARETVVQLARDAGMVAWHGGVLANSVAAEALTSVLIFMNRRYKVPGAGIRITGLTDAAEHG
jgi:NADPH-dependent F420 reductase